jgi:hypothetical protein
VQAFTAFMAPRVFLDIDGIPADQAGDGRRTMPLMGKHGASRKDVDPGDNGKCAMDVLEVEDLLRDISG